MVGASSSMSRVADAWGDEGRGRDSFDSIAEISEEVGLSRASRA